MFVHNLDYGLGGIFGVMHNHDTVENLMVQSGLPGSKTRFEIYNRLVTYNQCVCVIYILG